MSILQRGALSALLALAGAANADSLDYLAAGTMTTGGWGATAQTFSVASGETLSAYSFTGSGGNQDYKFSVYDWTTGGSALYSVTKTWTGGVNTIDGINLALVAGHTYAAEIDYLGHGLGVNFENNVYDGGQGYWGSSGINGNMNAYSGFSMYDTAFKADFSPTSAVPEEGTPAMLLAGLGLLGVAASRRRRVR